MKKSFKAIVQFAVISIFICFGYLYLYESNTNALKEICNDLLYKKTDDQIEKFIDAREFVLRDAFDIVGDGSYTRFLMKNSAMYNPAVCQLEFKDHKVVNIKFFPPL